MIRLQDLTPEVYYKQSRDFQLLGRLYDIILNSTITSTEVLYNVPFNSTTDDQLIELASLTLGFNSKHKYNVKQLTAICSIFSTILKNKGSEKAIQLAVDALIRAENIRESGYIYFNQDECTIEVWLPNELTDTTLFNDLLDYILPAGTSCIVYRGTFKTEKGLTDTNTLDSVGFFYESTTGEKHSKYHGDDVKSLTEMSIVPRFDGNSCLETRTNNPDTLTTTNMSSYLDSMVVPKIKNIEK